MPTFFVGTHEPSWLRRTAHELFISRRRLARLRRVYRGLGAWALDSGGFTELAKFGRWTVPAGTYADEASRWAEEVGRLAFAAIQDWMCEPTILGGGPAGRFTAPGTGLSTREHQDRTVASYLELVALAPAVPWAPVLQGWLPDDYLACAELYRSAGVDLAKAPAVGVGSVCRRQATREAEEILLTLRPLGLKLHGFGLKIGFLKRGYELGLASFDSMAWSDAARRRFDRLPGCVHPGTCANCLGYAMRWRDEILRVGARPRQAMLL